MTSAPEETELKFTLTAEALDQLRWEVFGSAEARPLTSTYYDTPDHALAERRVALRLRFDGQGWVQTIKRGGGVSRYEDEVPREAAELDASRLEQAGVEPELSHALAPVFEVKLNRRTLELSHGDSIIELALDEGAVRADGTDAPLRELELELKAGTLPDLFGAARQIALRTGVRLSLTSKAEQGYRLARGEALEPSDFTAPPLAADVTVREAFQALALATLGQLCTAAHLVAQVDSAEAVHQARVALRRLRVLVGGFDAVADARVDAVKAELKRMTALFADARSLDVFAQDALPTADEAGGALLASAVERARAAAHDRARAGVRDIRFAAGLLELAEWIVCGPWTQDAALGVSGDRSLAEVAGDLLRRRRKRMLKRGRKLDWSDAHARHKLRIQAKKMHYLVDALAPSQAGGRGYRRLKRLQARLGELNDIATAPQTARLALDDAAPVLAGLAAGLALGEKRAGADRLVRKARRAFRKWSRGEDAGASAG